jgi:hypothetical protein
LGTKNSTWLDFSEDIWVANEKVTSNLIAPFTENEIKTVAFSMSPNKALGPDVFSILFY